MYGGEKCMQALVEKPQGKVQLRRHRGKWNGHLRYKMGSCKVDSYGSGQGKVL